MLSVDVICLANSRKMSGRCVAGVRLDGGGWIRPVTTSKDADGALSREHYRMYDGVDAAVLDVVRMHLDRRATERQQPENWILAPRRWWLVARPVPDAQAPILAPHIVRHGPLLGTFTDRISLEEVAREPSQPSLALVLVQDVTWRIIRTPRNDRQVRAIFHHDRTTYDLVITDPAWERRLIELRVGVYPKCAAGLGIDDSLLLTISRGRSFEGSCYKLVAAIAVVPPRWRSILEATP